MKIEEYKEIEKWAEQQWGKAEVGDKRRAARAVKVGTAIAAQPDASLPKQMGGWKNLKAAYRLFCEQDVTHQGLGQQHWEETIEQAASSLEVVLFIQDLSEFSYKAKVKGIGHIGNGTATGLVLHSCLAIRPKSETAEILGLAYQKLWARTEIKHGTESRTQRSKRSKESDLWAQTLEQIGIAATPNWISIGDSASDIFSYVRRAAQKGWKCILRVSQDRAIETPAAQSSYLKQWARELKPKTKKSLLLRGRDGMPKREVELKVAYSVVTIRPPKGPESKQDPIKLWCVRCWEESNDEDAIEWILLTNLEVNSGAAALQIIEYYSLRWVIEEYHKCLKTGCGAEKSQFETAQSIQALLGFLAVVAVRLLQLREMSRTAPQTQARLVVPSLMVDTVVARLGLVENRPLTLDQFWRGVARLGGFIGRKSDGNPGWQTLWAGWKRLQDLCWFIDAPLHSG
jgi:hypothetical protein